MASAGQLFSPDRPWLRVLAIAPALVFVLYILKFSVNVPGGDDFVILDDVVALRQAATPSQFVEALFESHEEHRLVLTRSLTYASSWLPGGIDFRGIELLGVAALLGSLAMIGRLLGLGSRWGLWAILLLVMLQPQQHKLMFYPMAAVQAYFGLFFAMAYLHLLLQGGRTVSALLCLAGAALTSGAWIILPLLCCLILLARRDWRGLARHCAAGAFLALVYFHGELGPRYAAVAYAVQHPLEAVRLFLGISGAVAELPTYRYSSLSEYTILATGSALTALTAALALRGWRAPDPAPSGGSRGATVVLIYCAMMIGLIVANRIDLYHNDWLAAALDGRYRLYGLLVFAVVLVELVRRFESRAITFRRVWIGTLVAALTLHIGWYAYRADSANKIANDRVQALQHWRDTGDPSGLWTGANTPQMAGEVLTRAANSKIYYPE